MARLGVAGIALALVLAPDVAMAAVDSGVGAPPVPPMPVARSMRLAPPVMVVPPGADRWTAVPGGWAAYRQPRYGYTLPRYWVASAHFISDYRGLGLPQPAWGYGWSRYYDDAVLTDRWGRVYDWRSGDALRDLAPRAKHRRDRNGVIGAIVGGAVGALTGNVIAGAGSRLAGSLIGGGVGALAGQAIGREMSRGGYAAREPLMRPHWDINYVPGSEDLAVAEEPDCRQVETVRYVTDYVRMPARAAPRTKYVRRLKYVPLS